MSQYKASITFQLKDLFTQPLTKIKAGISDFSSSGAKTIGKLKSAWDQFNNDSLRTQTAANLALASQAFSNTANQINALVSAPRNIAASFETGMARVSTVLTATNAISGDTTQTFNSIENAAKRMASGLTQAGKLASIGIDVYTNSVYTMLSSGGIEITLTPQGCGYRLFLNVI